MLLQFLDDRLVGALRHALHVEASVELGVGHQHADLLPLLLAHGRDGAHQFVFSRQALAQKWQHDLVQAAGNSHAHENIFRRAGAAHPSCDPEDLAKLGHV